MNAVTEDPQEEEDDFDDFVEAPKEASPPLTLDQQPSEEQSPAPQLELFSMSEAPSDFKSPVVPESTTNPINPGDFSASGLLGEFMKDFKHEESKDSAVLSPEKTGQVQDISPAKEGMIKDVLG